VLLLSSAFYSFAVVGQTAVAKADDKKQDRPTPTLPEEESADNKAMMEADLVISEVRSGHSDSLWHALQRNSDPAVRAYLIDRLPRSGAVHPRLVVKRLRTVTDAGERAALVLSLGGFTEKRLPEALRKSITGSLVELYRTDPDPEVHSATEWLLRHRNDRPSPAAFHQDDYPFLHSNEGASQPRPEWHVQTVLAEAGRESTATPADDRNWTVNREGFTMVAIRPTGSFQMGAPADEPRAAPGETLHVARIPRTFALANKEVSVAQFQRYLGATDRRSKWTDALTRRFPRNTDRFTAWPEHPQFAVIWYDAAAYCNWLSAREGIPRAQWVYPDEIGPGMVMPADYLHRTGYRLATEAEWEFAARAGTHTAHFFGNGVALLDRYAWFMADSENHGWPVGMTKPNQLGLFDMYGNAWEWVQDRYRQFPANSNEVFVDEEDAALVVTNDAKRVRRGGSWSYDKETMRSAHRGAPHGYQLDNRMDSVGFRVARTLSPQ